MMSSTIDVTVRGDEANVCNRLGRYERRLARSLNHEDAETFDSGLFSYVTRTT